jgi:rhodanese-related sulfurtransferase
MTKGFVQKNKKIEKKGIASYLLWIILLFGAAYIAFLGIAQKPQTEAGKLSTEVSVAEAAKLRDQGAFILDVREQSEWDQFHIPGATLIPLGSLPDQLAKIPKDKTVIVVCRTGRRSAEGRDILLKAGYEKVTSMTGGVTEWQSKGLPIETGN